MTDLRQAAQQALEALKSCSGVPHWPALQPTIHALRAALAQQAEPLNLRDPAVQKRLATQWGYVPAAQAEPVQVAERERVASQWDGCVTHQLDTFGPVDIGASIRAGELVEAQQTEPVAWKQGNLVTFNEDPCPVLGGLFVQFWDGEEVAARVYANDLKTLRQRCAKVNTAPFQRKQAEPVEPVEPVAWIESPHGAIRSNPNHKFTFPSQLLHWQIPLYTAPPQRKPLTEEEIESCRQKGYAHAGLSAPFDFGKAARAVERAVWEKNHG